MPEERWVFSVAQTDTHRRVTIVKSAGDPQPQVLEIPVDRSLPTTLGEALYPYRQGEPEKVLLLTETRSRESFHSATALIGGGLFTRVGEGWRLELADRAITAVGSIGAAPGFDISVQSAGERGFIAILTDGSTHMGSTVTWLVLLSDTGAREQRIGVVGRVEDTSAESGSCPSGEGEESEFAGMGPCFSYDSKWKLVPNPERALPDMVVTTAGTHLGEGKRPQVESFHKVRTFSVSPAGEYSESWR